MALAQAIHKGLLDHFFGKSTYTAEANIYVGLSSTLPTSTGGNVTEPSGGSYARVETEPADWNAATSADPSETTAASETDISADLSIPTVWFSATAASESDASADFVVDRSFAATSSSETDASATFGVTRTFSAELASESEITCDLTVQNLAQKTWEGVSGICLSIEKDSEICLIYEADAPITLSTEIESRISTQIEMKSSITKQLEITTRLF